MGRLFWKFFAFIWIAQLGGIVAIASTFWLHQARMDRVGDRVDSGPGAGLYVGAAAGVLRFGGVSAFKDWAAREPRHVVFAVSDDGRDLLDRIVPANLVNDAKSLRARQPESPQVALVELPGSDSNQVLLFARAGPGIERPGADGPPPPGGPAGPHYRSLPPIGPLVATLLASLLTAALLAWYVAKPIKNLRHAFAEASTGRLEHRIAPLMGTRQDELADLGHEFDRMAERLQEAMDRQRRLLHDVSHEVRSPLARLHAAVGLLRQKHSAQETTIDRIEEEIARIDRLVAELLKLSRLEAGELAEEIQEVDMQELVAQIVDDANFEVNASGRIINWTDRAAATLRGRPEMLHVAFENIVRNAIKHAPGSTAIQIRTSIDATASRYAFRVLDDGPGVPPGDLTALFTPFFRTASSTTEGYGLGLAIARRSIEAHGGTIDAANRPGGGLQVEVLLPL